MITYDDVRNNIEVKALVEGAQKLWDIQNIQ